MKTPAPGADLPVVAAAAATAAHDAVVTVSMYERQAKVYPRAVSGAFARWRVAMVVLTQLVFYATPWLTWNGRQAVLFDLAERRFFIFGLVLWPQDLIYLAALLVISALALFFFTAVAGRLWCGYACPQTVYTEIFLWIERQTEGDRGARMRLDAAPWSAGKLGRKGGKHALWLAVSLWTGFTFVGYFAPIRALAAQVPSLALSPWEGFWVLFYGLATYGNAGWMREQICKYMCPYARFQGTLIDRDSLIIAYDISRGEPRGARRRRADSQALGLGDCTNCTLCVQVCPTGIDIRNGLQNECIGCAACIDVCDDVMGKMGYARGLIRYATARGMAAGADWRQMFSHFGRARVLAYGLLLGGATLSLGAGLALRAPFAVDVMRDRGTLARLAEDGGIENVYRLRLTNRTEVEQRYRISAQGVPGLAVVQGAEAAARAADVGEVVVRLALPQAHATGQAAGAHVVTFLIDEAGADSRTVRAASTFLVPR